MQQGPSNTGKHTSDNIIAIKILSGTHAVDIMASDCHYMHAGVTTVQRLTGTPILESLIEIPGVWFRLDATKSPIPIQELDQFVPMTAIVRIVYHSL